MVQRKVSNKLGIQANKNLLKTDNRQANIKPSLQTHDGRSKTPDLKTKKMKKSRSIKRADLEISLRSSARQPEKPPPLGSPANTPSPKKKASPSSYGSPNYMKSTISSEARKEPKTKASSSSPSKLHHKVAKTLLSRVSSLKKVRTLTKAPSFKHTRTGVNKCSKVVLCENLEVQRNTCSSTLKDSKFPPYLKLNPGATEAQGTSVMKVCSYNYCSLNGHHHKPAPPLRCFLASRRKLLKTQKLAKPEILSPRKAKIPIPQGDHNEDFFIEIRVPSEDTEEVPLTPEKDQISYEFSCNGEDEEGDKSGSVSLDEFFGETSDMEWEEGQTNISDQKDDGCDQDKPGFELEDNEKGLFEDFIAEKLKSYFDEDIMEWECFSDADSVTDSESTQPDEEQTEDPSEDEKEDTINSGQKDETTDEGTISANPDFRSIEGQDTFFSEDFDEIIEAGNEGRDSDQESVETHSFEAVDNSTSGVIEEKDNADTSMEERISSDDMIKEILPKIEDLEPKEEDPMASDDSEVEVNQNEANESMITCSANSKEQNEDCIAAIEAPEMEDINKIEEPEAFTVVKDEPHSKGHTFFNGVSDSSQELLESCNKLKRWMRCKKENDDDEEEGREFNPRDPNFLPLEPEPEAEKVDLRHQDMDERRNAEEWMLDYAMQKTVNQLAPARKRKVALLVEAFEAVLPIPKFETQMRTNSSGFSQARTLQACS